jgi:hypothetical protein
MADRVLFISWGEVVRGREERAMENFNETVGLYGRFQQEGKIEGFDVVLLDPATDILGYMEIQCTSEQLGTLKEDREFRRQLAAASLIVDDLKMVEGYTGNAIAREMEMYMEEIAKVAQHA